MVWLSDTRNVETAHDMLMLTRKALQVST